MSQGTNTIRLYVPTYNAQYGAVRVTASTSCGTATNGITAYPNSYCGGYLTSGEFVIYPNPADEQLTIEQAESPVDNSTVVATSDQLANGLTAASMNTASTNVGLPNEAIFNVELMNSQQVVVAKGTSQGKKITLETRTLSPGFYFLQIYYEKKVLQEQIIVQ